MEDIQIDELKKRIDQGEKLHIIDVREEYEFDEANINGELIPMGEVMDNVAKISKDKQVVIHCRSGKRSATVISALESQHGYTNLYNLKGGILAYLEEVK